MQPSNSAPPFPRAVAVISLDSEQIWGYFDLMNERKFTAQFPNVCAAYDGLLNKLCLAGVRATWLLVGALALRKCEGAADPTFVDLPSQWVKDIPSGNELSAPLWFRRSFVQRLSIAKPKQEIGLHGGLTHLIWTDWLSRKDVLRIELERGSETLANTCAPALSFSFPRNGEAHHELLPAQGIICYRGRLRESSQMLGRSLFGAATRAFEELRAATPVPVWPVETLPGLWNIPASLYLYPIADARTKMIPIKTRVERFARGLQAAIRSRGIFHFCFHPANLAQSEASWPMLDSMLSLLVRAREAGELEILTMTEVAQRAEECKNGRETRLLAAAQ